ncbi:MarR family transcriptional regulator, partial [Pseudomonas sp. ATCC 13867]
THDDLFAPLDDAQQQMLTHLLQQCLPDRTA